MKIHEQDSIRPAMICALAFVALMGCSNGDELVFSLERRENIDDDQWARIEAGATEWAPLRLYYDRNVGNADRVIAVEMDELEAAGLAFPDESRIVLSSLYLARLQGTVTHELGHVLLDTDEHLPANRGIMSSPHVGKVLTVDDLEFACRVAARCY